MKMNIDDHIPLAVHIPPPSKRDYTSTLLQNLSFCVLTSHGSCEGGWCRQATLLQSLQISSLLSFNPPVSFVSSQISDGSTFSDKFREDRQDDSGTSWDTSANERNS